MKGPAVPVGHTDFTKREDVIALAKLLGPGNTVLKCASKELGYVVLPTEGLEQRRNGREVVFQS